ncbi:Fur family transcriptional regulator [uncultured Cardiobacterium sp.]|uniref:Fur family transcriptional regulator n=1 Tax=uncultured Cardiobacterium sp. TaxID=417619 RepID=UPI0026247F50|nr:Fur family transcriptional regulator [uncultured Cardiobacterium sp.]
MNKRQIASTVAKVEQYCIKRGVRLTPIRRQVLELLLTYPNVVKAYEILDELKKQRKNAAPPTVYRALDFFVEIGVLHRAESLNGFVFCSHFDEAHTSVILNCTHCGATEELAAEEPVDILLAFCRERGFTVQDGPLVLSGECARCHAGHALAKGA